MKARKKPVEIEFYPCEEQYLEDIIKWSTKERPIYKTPCHDKILLNISTLEWVQFASKEDMIIKGVQGEVYPCKKDIFELTYNIIETDIPYVDPNELMIAYNP